MTKRHKSLSGSLAYKPRKRAKKEIPRIHHWPESEEAKPLGFAGYKAGMTHALVKDNRKKSRTAGSNVFTPLTVLETPPLLVRGIRAYANGYRGKETFLDVLVTKKDQGREKKLKELEGQLNGIEDIFILAETQPKLAGLPKKSPDSMEIALGGTLEEKFNFAKEKLGKEISLGEVFQENSLVDIHGVTKGKGFQGVIKRHGTMMQPRKFGKGRRHIGSGGSWKPARKLWNEPLPGQLGYHSRTEYNKLLLKIGENPEEINLEGGFLRYGLIKGNYALLKGSVPGPAKRLIRLTKARRALTPEKVNFSLIEISKESKQGA